MAQTTITQFAKNWLPPVIQDFVAVLSGRRIKISGKFERWEDVAGKGKGYAAGDILERVKQATDKVLTNPDLFERDGVVFDEKAYPLPLISCLLLAAKEAKGRLVVLDFGGSLGSTYRQCRDFFSGIPELKWCVIEQDHFVECGKKNYETDTLKFYKSIEECYQHVTPNVALFSSVLQYLQDPGLILQPLVAKGPEYIIVDRTPFIEDQRSRIALQTVPKTMGKASYPIRLLIVDDLVRHMQGKYRILCTFNALDTDLYYYRKRVSYKGIVFEKLKG